MRILFALSFLVLSFNVFADYSEGTPIKASYPIRNGNYGGTPPRIDGFVRSVLLKEAIKVCGTEENVLEIADIEIETFETRYPYSTASAVVYCKE